LLHAQAPLHYFDLVVTTPQYRLPERSNVLHNLLPLNAAPPEVLESSVAQWRQRLEHLPRPWIAVLVGGNSSSYRLDAFTARQLGQFASRAARESGGSLLISTSPRTHPDAADALLTAVQGPAYIYRWQPTNKDENAYLAYLALADRFIVTADSASMLAEACSTGRPVELFNWTPRRQSKRLLRALLGSQRFEEALIHWGVIKPKRDFQALHRELMERGLLCSSGQEQSLRPAKPDDLERTVTRIRRLMGEGESEGANSLRTSLSLSIGPNS
ncbi:MAG TPA: ELM1/GtrOC1 family putative glycosyltransferase, partial [Candidatus Binatia bacterium]|nr:ELM1/GtrOC1 family putative glycosyltransferase [Candidatus Binatia bacterium]